MSIFPFHAFLDAHNGNDGTAQLTNADRPFKTFAAAYGAVVIAALQGDVWVFCLKPGPYNENFTLNDPTFGSQITGPTNAVINGVITVSNTASAIIRGLTLTLKQGTAPTILNGQGGVLILDNDIIEGGIATSIANATDNGRINLNNCKLTWIITQDGGYGMFIANTGGIITATANTYNIGPTSSDAISGSYAFYDATENSSISDTQSTLSIMGRPNDVFVLIQSNTVGEISITNMSIGVSVMGATLGNELLIAVANSGTVNISNVHFTITNISIDCPPWIVRPGAFLTATVISENGRQFIPCDSADDVGGNVSFNVTTGGGSTISNAGQSLGSRTIVGQQGGTKDQISIDDYALYAKTKKGSVTLCLPLQDPNTRLKGKIYQFRNMHPYSCNKFVVKSKDAKIDKKSKRITIKTKIGMQFHDGWWTL